MRNFGSRDVYNLNDSTPVYANACSLSDFASQMDIQTLQIGTVTGMKNATIGGFTGGSEGKLSGGLQVSEGNL
ncbi:hypothetical protein ABID23_000270 [Bartonella silvatica]|uniref:Uncharacterized protein n=1 Tax=Bartonella silvatica TaxID=357760 RepID=A0ABV2HF79_9HYPH